MHKKTLMASICVMAFAIDTASSSAFLYVPQYEILDPRTGRSLRDPRTRSSSSEQSSSSLKESNLRPQREISTETKYILPIGKHRDYKLDHVDILDNPAELSSVEATDKILDTVRQSRAINDLDKPFRKSFDFDAPFQSSDDFHKDSEGSLAKKSNLNHEIYFRPLGYQPLSVNAFSSPFSFDRASFDAELFGKRSNDIHETSSTGDADLVVEVPSSAGYIIAQNIKPSKSDKYVIGNGRTYGNAYGGLLPYKWRKKYPIYGRKKRSAQQSYVKSYESKPLRRQVAWALLDPITGRPKNDAFEPVHKTQSLDNPEEVQHLEPHKRVLRLDRESQFLHNVFIDPRINSRGRPIYKHHKRYPYSG